MRLAYTALVMFAQHLSRSYTRKITQLSAVVCNVVAYSVLCTFTSCCAVAAGSQLSAATPLKLITVRLLVTADAARSRADQIIVRTV
jgi:hypothetical protein